MAAFLAPLVFIAACSPAREFRHGGGFGSPAIDETRTVDAEGRKWEYIFAKPQGQAKGLILAFHGAGGSGKQFAVDSRWVETATSAGFAIALPTGVPILPNREPGFQSNPNVWNSGEFGERGPRQKIDDTKALALILATCDKELGKLPVFLAGHSNGAGMTYMMASRWKDRVGGIGMMAGDLKCDLGEKPSKPIPSLIYAGENDPLLLWEGGVETMPWGNLKRHTEPVLTIVGKWAAWNGLTKSVNPKEGDGTVTYDYGNNIKLVMIKGQGHVWPGGQSGTLFGRNSGKDSGKVDATREIVDFFKGQLR